MPSAGVSIIAGIGAISPFVGIGGLLLAIKEYRKSRESADVRVHQEAEDIRRAVLGEEARAGVARSPGMGERFDQLSTRLDSINTKLAEAALLNGKGEWLVQQTAELRDVLTTHTAAMNANLTLLHDDVRTVSGEQAKLLTALRADRQHWRKVLTDQGIEVPPPETDAVGMDLHAAVTNANVSNLHTEVRKVKRTMTKLAQANALSTEQEVGQS